MKLGDKIFVYEQLGRHARTFEDHLAKWKEYTIVDETKVSWIARFGKWESSDVKIDKKTGKSRGKERIAASHDEIRKMWEDERWTGTYLYRIADRLRFVRDPEVVRKIAELIGYDPSEEER